MENSPTPPVTARRQALAVVFGLFLANCAALWLMEFRVFVHAARPSALGAVQLVLAYLSQLALIALVFAAPQFAAAAALPRRNALLWALAPLWSLLLFTAYVDSAVYERFRMHFSGAILSFLTTPGVKDSLPFSARDFFKAGLLLLGFAAAEHLAARGLWRLAEKWPALPAKLGRHVILAAGILLAAVAVEKSLYAFADIKGRRDILVNARAIPLYLPATCKGLAKRLGLKPEREHRIGGGLSLNYPLRPVSLPEQPKGYNVLWIAVEEWRAEEFNPRVAPNLWRFGQRCLVGRRHYSSGNTTRYGIFGMFYGLDGFYWQPFLAERQGPVFLDALREMGYQIRAMGSANFDNPELRLTCFANLRDEEVFGGFPGRGADGDMAMTAKFGEFLDRREELRPFFAFLFLDGPHTPRLKLVPGFTPPFAADPEPSVRQEKLAGDPRERERALRAFRNAIAFADFLIGRTLDDLERRGLLANTIVMIAGDHGEEFGEGGFSGHNSSFDDWQTATMFLLHYPGVQPGQIDKLTSHADWAPTTLGLLGVTTPPGDYCQGLDILGAARRDYVVAASWSNAAIITAEGGRMAFPLESYRLSTLDVYDGRGRPLADREGFLARHGPKLAEVLESARRFRR